MPVLAGWLTGEQVPQEMVAQVLLNMGNVLAQHAGQAGQQARTTHPGAGLLAFAEPAYATLQRIEPPILDWSPDRRTLVYRRPLAGAHPLYYIENWPAQGNLLFASEIKALFAVGAPRRLHLPALAALLRYGFIPAPWTAFQDIHVVPAGSSLRWQRSKIIVNPSTDYIFDKSPSSTQHLDILDQFSTILDNTIAALLPAHEQLVALSRGNSASALTCALAAQHAASPFTVASLGYRKPSRKAEQLAGVHQLPFLAITSVDRPEFWIATLLGLEAPCIDSHQLAWHQLLHTVSVETGARVALTGQGATSLLAATEQFTQKPVEPDDASQEQTLFHSYVQIISPPAIQPASPIWSAEAAQLLREAEPWEETHHARKLARQAEKLPPEQRWRYLDLHLRLPDRQIGPAHQLAAQERVALRSPYLIPEVTRLLTSLPPTLADGTPGQTILTTLAKHYFPADSVMEQLKQAPEIIPTQSLLDIEQSALLQQTISEEALRATGIFDVEAVQELLRTGKQTGVVARELVLVFTTQLLCRLFEVGL
ncbi:MAG TPA: asparagine synthase-related protein [Ktedonobacteraceae bacterium]|nr:asparagine synthase-related protein [Ktedonobacteraceae bacterium]